MMIQKWKQCGVRAQGKDHIASGVTCQDNVAELSCAGVHAIALSDGGGSRKYSEIGSEHATKAACRLLCERFDAFYSRLDDIDAADKQKERLLQSLRLEILDEILAALRTQVTAERSLRDFGCTLQFAAVKDGKYIVGHIGDGVIAGLYQIGLNRKVQVLSHPENGGAPNVTFFVTDHDAKDHLRFSHGECRQLEGILMMSDGPEEVLYSGADGMHQNTLKLFDNFRGVTQADYAAALSKFLTGSIAKHSYDDLSLNILYLEAVDGARTSSAYAKELFAGLRGREQLRRVSSYAYFVDPTLPCDKEEDISFLRG